MPRSRTSSPTTIQPGALRLDMAVKFLKGVGERRAEQLERLGIRTARDLLWHLPHRYVDASSVTFRQEVTDPLSPVKTRDVRKSLYASEEARQ